MTPERWKQVKEVLAAILQREPKDRSAYLDEIGAETWLRGEVESLLAVHQENVTIDQTITELPVSQFGSRYQTICKLGEGGMGTVYKAHDNDLNRLVALKVVRPSLTANPEIIHRFKQELLLASKISHKNVLRIHDLGDHEGMKFISMAYVEGHDLSHILKQETRLPIDRTVHIAMQLCSALEAAESEGVVHRDLKPSNILLDRADSVYVSDFGLAKSLESDLAMTRAGQYLGTPRYMSPEQAKAKPTDHRSDIYSLGVILYEMVTGETPFHADTPWELLQQRLYEKPKSPKLLNAEVPEYLSNIILKCLEVNPGDRYQHAQQILNDLRQEQAPPPPRSVHITLPWLSQRGWLIAAIAALAVVLAGLAIPAIREVVLHRSAGSGGAGIPSLRQGKFVGVLPFRTLGGDQATLSYVSEGLVEALSAKLFQLREVHTASVSASQTVKQTGSLKEMARQLGINLAISGTIQGTGERVRIIVSLDDVADDRRLWTQEFSGVPEDLLTLEDQIYSTLVQALALNPSQEEMARSSARPTENGQAYDFYLRGRAAMRAQLDVRNVETAISYYEQAIKQDPGFALAYTGLADASLRMYREKKDSVWADKALGYAQQAQRLDDTPAEVHFALGSVYNATGKSAEAVAELRRALELAPNNDEGYRRLGDTYRATGRQEEAIRAYEKAIEISPYYWFNWNALGSAYFRLGENQKALEAFQRVAALEPSNAAAYRNIGAVFFQQSKWNESIAAFQKSLEIEQHQVAYSNLGTVFFYLKRYDDAAKMFEKAVQMSPNYQLGIGNLADAYRWSGRTREAMAAYDKAIALAYKELQVNPRDANAMQHLAQYYSRKGDSAQALEFIRRAMSIDPANASLLYTQAVIYSSVGRQEEAFKLLREALQKGFPLQAAKNDPELDKLHTKPEFAQLLKNFSKN
jgi:serine/threonine protein kinase/tetratricopeptide (TPR) repeat protein